MLSEVVVDRLHNFDVSELRKLGGTLAKRQKFRVGGELGVLPEHVCKVRASWLRICRLSRTRVQSAIVSVLFLEHVCKVRVSWLRIRRISRTRVQNTGLVASNSLYFSNTCAKCSWQASRPAPQLSSRFLEKYSLSCYQKL